MSPPRNMWATTLVRSAAWAIIDNLISSFPPQYCNSFYEQCFFFLRLCQPRTLALAAYLRRPRTAAVPFSHTGPAGHALCKPPFPYRTPFRSIEPWTTITAKEALGAGPTYRLGRVDGVLQQRAGDLHRNDPSVLDVVLDERPKLGALALPFLAQQIPRGKVRKAKVLDNLLALGALAGPGSSQDKHNLWLLLGAHFARGSGATPRRYSCNAASTTDCKRWR